MKRFNGVSAAATAVLVLLVSANTARAQKSFDEVARGAEWVPSKKALAPLFWAFAADCSKRKNDLARRQCELISAARKKAIAGKRFLVEADVNAFLADKYDPKKKTIAIGVRPCLACSAPLKVGRKELYVVGDKAKAKGDKVDPMYTSTRSFATAKQAEEWRSDITKRVRTQFVVEIPATPAPWKAGTKSGFRVNIVGFRAYDPCDGRIVCASPQAARERPNRRACSGKAIVEDTRPTDKKVTPVVETIPYRLNTRQIAAALRPAVRRARKCKDTFGMTGTAQFTITISADGKIIGLKESGDFVDTPTGDCIAKEVKKVTFPKSKKARTTITYPVILQ